MKTSLRLAALAAFLGLATAKLSAVTITLGASELLGKVIPGTPASDANSEAQVKFLVDKYNLGLGNSSGQNIGDNPADDNDEIYYLYRPVAAPIALDAPVFDHAVETDPENPVINLNGITYQYALFFQASSAWIYYIGNISGTNAIKWGGDPVAFPANNENGDELSHYVLFKGTTTEVPDTGTTIMQIGLAFVSLCIASRRLKA